MNHEKDIGKVEKSNTFEKLNETLSSLDIAEKKLSWEQVQIAISDPKSNNGKRFWNGIA